MPDSSKPELLPVYLLCGSDELQKKELLKRLVARFDSEFSELNIDYFDAQESLEIEQVTNALYSLAFGSSHRLVVVLHADKLVKAQTEALVEYLAAPSDSSVLCLVMEKVSERSKLYKAIVAHGAQTIVRRDAPSKKTITSYLNNLAAQYGLSLDMDANRELISRLGMDTELLKNQVEGLSYKIQPRNRIELSDIRSFVPRLATPSVWEFYDAVAARNTTLALELFEQLPASDYIRMMIGIQSRLRELICLKSLISRGEAARLCQELGKPESDSWKYRAHQSWVQKFREGELEKLLKSCLDCERVLKGSGDSRAAFTQCIIEICTAR